MPATNLFQSTRPRAPRPQAWSTTALQCGAAICLAACSPSAQALCTLVCICTMTTTNAQFATYNPLGYSSVDSTATVTVSCGGVLGLLIPYEVRVSTGSGTFAQRTMTTGTNQIGYNFYADPNYTAVWGDGTGGTTYFSGSFPLALLGAGSVVHTIYGRIPARQLTVPPGTYSDTLNVTFVYF
ncbi:Spore coat protein U (SCPU) domain-containing protein [Roseateles sp. YR242]|uniref:Csu type fimbrial protein n=1 Tax=Roseateles sp. YR242 TaxID=1855305 RepID=UPI0008C5EE23|nr:spore coat U domain-containing protein [Roseateles sp. YR242]SEK30603.1 Spore coat protein U (SCPU) domain-containing protein [Roseateles sp. YR242]